MAGRARRYFESAEWQGARVDPLQRRLRALWHVGAALDGGSGGRRRRGAVAFAQSAPLRRGNRCAIAMGGHRLGAKGELSERLDIDPSGARCGCFLPDLTRLARHSPAPTSQLLYTIALRALQDLNLPPHRT